MEIEDLISLLLKKRGLNTPKEIQDFFHPSSPLDIPVGSLGWTPGRVLRAVKLIRSHMEKSHPIAVYGDYDVDGICSTAIFWETLFSKYNQVFPHIPHRKEEGYGLSRKGIDHCLDKGAKLIIAVDNGIVACSQVAYCRSRGCDIIIVDHHEPGAKLPDANVILHSVRTCAAGLSWFFCREMSTTFFPSPKLGEGGPNRAGEVLEMLQDQLSLVAIAVVCDIVPLLGLNRSLIKYGLEELNHTRRPGLLALFKEAGLKGGEVKRGENYDLNTYHVGFIIGPRLNAMGRLEHAIDSLRILCTHNPVQAESLAKLLNLTNLTRQQLTESAVSHAVQSVIAEYGQNLPKLLMVADSTYDQGVIGLIAARLVEKFSRPAIAASLGQDTGKASARSLPGFHITSHIRQVSRLLTEVGGHAMAAGFSFSVSKYSRIKKSLLLLAEKKLDPKILIRETNFDAEIPISQVTRNLYLRLLEFAPFGLGNPQPVFISRNTTINSPRRIGATQQHLKFTAGNIQAIFFNRPDLDLSSFPVVDLVYRIEENRWNGKTDMQLIVKDIKFTPL